jgi:hypothetical protein
MGECYEARSCRPASRASARLTAHDPAALGSPTRLSRRLAGGLANALASGLACGRLLGGPASRRLLDFPFHYPLCHLVIPLSGLLSLSSFEVSNHLRTKKSCASSKILLTSNCYLHVATSRIPTNLLREIIIFLVFLMQWLVVCIFRIRFSRKRASAIERVARAKCGCVSSGAAALGAMHHAAFTTRLCKSRTAIM